MTTRCGAHFTIEPICKVSFCVWRCSKTSVFHKHGITNTAYNASITVFRCQALPMSSPAYIFAAFYACVCLGILAMKRKYNFFMGNLQSKKYHTAGICHAITIPPPCPICSSSTAFLSSTSL